MITEQTGEGINNPSPVFWCSPFKGGKQNGKFKCLGSL